MPPYPPFRAPVKRSDSTSSFPPPQERDKRRQSQTGESDAERIARLEAREEFLERQHKILGSRLDAVEKAESESTVRTLLREAEEANAKLARDKAEAIAQKKIDADAAAELQRALASAAAWRSFKYGLLASIIMFALGIVVAHWLH